MKKNLKNIFCILIAIFTVLIVGVGAAKVTVTYTPDLPVEEPDDYTKYLDEEWSSVRDLSDRQGYRNWYYYCGDADQPGTLALMSFNDYYGRWSSKYQQLYFDTYMWSSVWLPDGQTGMGIGMGFLVPATGKLSVKANVTLLSNRDNNAADGVVFCITDKTGLPLGNNNLTITPDMGAQTHTINMTLDMEKGDEVLFMLFPNTNNNNDFTDVEIIINYVK